jgi:hypothetical protein
MNRKPYLLPDNSLFHHYDRARTKTCRTDLEWLTEYPQEISQIFTQKIGELRMEAQALRRSLSRQLKLITQSSVDEFSKWFVREWLKATDAAQIVRLESKATHFKRVLSIFSIGPSNWDGAVEHARGVPILEVIGLECNLRRSGHNYMSKCPFHDERTPSFYVYPEKNNFHCFGCGAHGDVISYVMQLNHLGFKDAVKMLAGGSHE